MNLTYNITGQTLYWDAPESRPTSVTSVTVYSAGTGDDGTAEVATTGSAAVETNPDTTFDANSGDGQVNPRVLNLAATTGMAIGRKYLATNAAGETEFLEITSITSGASAECRHNPRNSYASADTFEGTRISISILDTWIQDETNVSDDLDPRPGYRVRWTYVDADSVTRVHDSYFNVVRYSADHSVTAGDVDLRRPGWMESLPTEHAEDQGAKLIDAAYADLKFDLKKRSIPAEMLRDREVVNYMTVGRAIVNFERERAVSRGDIIGYEIAREEYFGALDGLIPDKTAIATDTEGAASPVSPLGIMGK